MKKLIALIPLIWLAIHLIPIKETELTQDLLNNQEQVPLSINGDVYLKGFNVPNDQSPTEYGLSLYKKFETIKPEISKESFEAMDDISFNAPKDSYRFQGNDMGLGCLYNDNEAGNLNCQSDAELKKTIVQNKLLLTRLRELWKYDYFDSDIPFSYSSYYDGKSFLLLQKLLHDELILLKKDNQSDLAIELWLKNADFLNKIIKGRYTLVDKAILLISIGDSRNALVKIIEDINLNQKQVTQLQIILSKPAFGAEGFNLRKTAQAEYNFIFYYFHHAYNNSNIFTKVKNPLFVPGYTKNKFSSFFNDYIKVGDLPPEQFLEEYRKTKKHYNELAEFDRFYFLKMLLYAPIESILFGGIYKGGELFESQFNLTVKDRMILLFIKARALEIKPDDMPNFLKNQSKELQNPITNSPFDWDGQNVYMSNSSYPDNIFKINYMPPPTISGLPNDIKK